MTWAVVTGALSARGPEAVLLRKGGIVGAVSMAYAGEIVQALNDAETPKNSGAATVRMHEVVREMYAMLRQHIDTRERDQFTGKESDDSKRALHLLEQAGHIAQGVS
jgi:3-mercaptopyruvate sulfurtransferase SseA